MRRFGVKLSAALLVAGTLSGLAVPTGASAKSQAKFVNSDFQRYYKSEKSKTAFHFETIQSGKKTQNYIILGDFGKNPKIQYAVPTTKYQLSKNGKTLSTKYRLIEFKASGDSYKASLSKKTYRFKLTKKSTSKFTTRLTTSTNRRFAASGKTTTAYTYTRTKTNPVKSYANKFAKPTLQKQAAAVVEAQYPDETSEQKAAMTSQLVDSAIKNMINNFNFKS